MSEADSGAPTISGNKYRVGLYRIAEQWPGLRYMGLGAWWAWIWICYNGTGVMSLLPEGTHADHVGLMYLFSTPAVAVMLVLAAVFWRQTTRLIVHDGVVIGFGALASFGTLLLAYSGFAGGPIAFAAGSVLTGVGTSVLCLVTGRVYGNANMRENLTAGTVSLMFAAFLYFMAMGIPGAWTIPFTALLPVVSALLYIMPGDDPFPADPDAQIVESLGKKAPGRRSFRRLVAASAIIAVTSGIGKGMASASDSVAFQTMGSAVTFSIFLFALAIFFYVNVGDLVRSLVRVYSALMIFGVAVLFLSCFGLNIGYMAIGKETLWMLFTCLMAYMVFRFDFSAVRAFGIGQAFYFVASTLAWMLGRYLNGLDLEYQMMFLAISMAFVIMVVFALVFTDADLKFILTWDPVRERVDAGVDAGAAVGGAGALSPGAAGLAPDAPGTGSPARQGVEGSSAEDVAVPGSGFVPSSQGLDGISTPMMPPDGPVADAVAGELTLRQKIDRLDPVLGVSDREKEVLVLFAEGRSANWIAEYLTISKNTVRTHIRNIYGKLDVHSRQELLDYFEHVG